MSSHILQERRGGVLLVTLNRSEVLNAVTPDMERDYFASLQEADRDPDIRAVVVTGAGRGFCAGADLSVSPEELAADGAPLPARDPSHYPPLLRTPVIAAVNGPCAGVGLAMALQADVRFVADSAKLATAFSRRGLIAEHGVAWLLPRIVGRARALDLLISGRTFTGSEAYRYGFAQFCLPAEDVLAAAMAYADDLADNCSPSAMAVIKRQVSEDDLLDPYDALLQADQATRESFSWPDLFEGIRAWQEGRPPRFSPVHPHQPHR
jgi:enoyl-CoA hydratase/carnithine racemase